MVSALFSSLNFRTFLSLTVLLTSNSLNLFHAFPKLTRIYNFRYSTAQFMAEPGKNYVITRDEPGGNTPENLKKDALEILDCLTAPKDTDDPQYDVQKDIRRDEILRLNDYEDLKFYLREKGLRSSGDKIEMITRLLLNVVDPSINFDQL